jgi:hypothetical protein
MLLSAGKKFFSEGLGKSILRRINRNFSIFFDAIS